MGKEKRHAQLVKSLCEARHRIKLTQAEVAKKLGRPQSFVSKYEQGERKLDVIEFIDICRALSEDPIQVLNLIVRPK